jgi:hypothetical protein
LSDDEATIRRSQYPGWIEVWHGAELTAEWHKEKDAGLWQVLDRVLRDDAALYRSPARRDPPPGRGPRLQEARHARPPLAVLQRGLNGRS